MNIYTKWMKAISIIFFNLALVTASPAVADAFQQVSLTKAQTFDDLEQFGEAIKGKRIVYLDELTHGEHEVFALKSRVVKYLHQEHGFNALVIESGLFDVHEVSKLASQNEDARMADFALGNVFFGYAKDPAFLGLLDYIDKHRRSDHPLSLAGFDGRLSGELSVESFVAQLHKKAQSLAHAEPLLQDWSDYAALLQLSLERKFPSLDERAISQHISRTYQLIDALNAEDHAPSFDSPAYYARLLEGVLRLFEVHYGVRRFDEHDLVMANNLYWLIENLFSDQKIIVWGHYVHLNKQGYLKHRAHNVTTGVAKAYEKESYVVNFSGLSGHFREFRDGSVKPLPSLPKNHLSQTFLSKFKADKSHAIFIQPSQFTDERYRGFVLYGHEYRGDYHIPVPFWQNHFDGVFLINQVSASN